MSFGSPVLTPSRSAGKLATPLRSPQSAQVSARHMQVVHARQQLAQAEAALRAAVELESGPPPSPAAGVSRASYRVAVAARVRAVLLARHEARLRRGLRAWQHSLEALRHDHEWEDVAADGVGGAAFDGGIGGGGAEAGGFLEVVLAHVRPTALQWALNTWSRAVASSSRAASQTALLEGKWAMQKAQQLDAAHREQIVRGVLRWWRNSDMARVWAQWQTVAALLPQLAAAEAPSPHVHVSLA